MKELREIVKAHKQAVAHNKRTALATVVHIEGSSYRQPGARMLITEDGMLTGAISGGCLEGDALRKALLVIANNNPVVVTYDTSDEDDAKIGIGLGCNGIIQILIEPVIETELQNPIKLIEQLLSVRQPGVLATIFSLGDRKSKTAGTRYLFQKGESYASIEDNELLTNLREAASAVSADAVSVITPGFADSTFDVLFYYAPPALAVVVVGAGNDVMPLAEITYTMGWDTTIADGRTNYATATRFPRATKVLLAKPGNVLNEIIPDDRTVFLLMTHNYNYDLSLLTKLLDTPTPYIGILGPKKKTMKMLDEIEASGQKLRPEQIDKIHGPTGLDTGAENSEEIALSICAEINAVMNKKSGTKLRNRTGPIHETTTPTENAPLK